jgi:hypothetical protein
MRRTRKSFGQLPMRRRGVTRRVARRRRTAQSPVSWIVCVTGFGPRSARLQRAAIHTPGARTRRKTASFRGDRRPARSSQGK